VQGLILLLDSHKEAPWRLFSLAIPVAAAIPVAWLLPNHYYPWLSAWQEGAALTLLFAAALLCRARSGLPALWAAALVIALGSVAWQWASGRIWFGGDALMAAFYLSAFGLAIALGAALATPERAGEGAFGPGRRRLDFVDLFGAGLVFGAVVSTYIALVQWTGAFSLGIWAADLPPGARPFANLAQPNHLCTLAFFGLAGLALLREGGRIGAAGWWSGATFLLLAMLMSGSRTGLVQLAVAIGLLLALGRRSAVRIGARTLLLLLALLVLGTLAWPTVNHALLLAGERNAAGQLQGGGRELLWPALVDAIGREPWSGYGWQQMVLAQEAVALDHAPIRRHFEHSHNIVLDLLVWAGVPVGGSIVLLAAAALWRQLRAVRDARALWLLVAVCGVLAHAMFEFPLEYAYFLLPSGLALGAAWALQVPTPARRWPAAALPVAGLALGALLFVIGLDYLEAEQNHRILRLESARIGVTKLETPAPRLRLLDQQQAFLEFARTEARRGMSAAELEKMRRVSQRFAYPPAMFRYAIAAGLNGQPEVAARTLARLCRIHPRARCDEARESWRTMQQRDAELRAVPLPQDLP